MTLLFDANLSPRLVTVIVDLFPGSAHLFEHNLGPNDPQIWAFAKSHDFAIVSKDSDFYTMSIMRGAPPKVVWLRVGNSGTNIVAGIVRANSAKISDFLAHRAEALLIIDCR